MATNPPAMMMTQSHINSFHIEDTDSNSKGTPTTSINQNVSMIKETPTTPILSVNPTGSVVNSDPMVLFDKVIIDQETMHKYNKSDTIIKIWTTTVFLLYIIFAIFASQTFWKNNPTKIIFILCVGLHTHYFIIIFRTIFGAKKLYRIRPKYRIIKHYAAMSFPYEIMEYPQYSIESLSELSSIRGSVTNYALILCGAFTFGTYLSLYLIESDDFNIWNTNNTNNTTNKFIGYTLFLLGNLGFTWMSYWELNPNDKIHVIMHYIGVGNACLTNVGLCFYTNWSSLFGYFLLFAMIIAAITWQICCCIAHKEQPSKDPKSVYRLSLECLLSEMIVLICCSIGFNYFLFII